MSIFQAADILIPQNADMEKWSVIACDQYTSQPEYWQKTAEIASGVPSALQLVFPECYLGEGDARIADINAHMREYLQQDLFKEYPDSYVYVERTLNNGTIRRGVVGAIALDAYEYTADSKAMIRATERTVIERIPPRVRIRQDAPLELPHIILLCDDDRRMLIETAEKQKDLLPKLYDFDLMQGGGHISGWLLSGAAADAFTAAMDDYIAYTTEKYAKMDEPALLFAVGDGNHSLATAKTCYEEIKKRDPQGAGQSPAAYALVELENLQDEAQQFEPIHRLVSGCDPQGLLKKLQETIGLEDENAAEGYAIDWYSEGALGTVYLDSRLGELPVAILQDFLDDYLANHEGEIDYIHDESALRQLSEKEGAIGFELPAIAKDSFFKGIAKDGVLPRKTFSMGHSNEKRYYLEARKII